MINKDRQRKAQTGKENINIIDTKEFNFYCYLDAYITMSEPSAIISSILLEHWTQLSKTHHLTRTSL